MKKMIVSLAFAFVSAVAWALPTTQQVEAAAQQGNYAQAESMMSEVVAAKPGSAKAHYVYAEILAHTANFTKAAEEAKKARQLDPKIAFTQPEKFEAFERMLVREQTPPARAHVAPATTFGPAAPVAAPIQPPSIPGWVWGAGLLAVGAVLWRGFTRSRSTASTGVATGMPSAVAGTGFAHSAAMNVAGAPYNPPYGPGVPAAPRPSSGMLGTGLAVAGGLAGGMLIGEMLHHRQSPGANPLGGLGPELIGSPQPDAAARDLEVRPVDFGNGGDWDAGSGSVDVGGGSDDGGWG